MAHQRIRYLNRKIEQHLKFSCIVGIFGHRQVGKTTLVSSFEDRDYYTLDQQSQLEEATELADQFVLKSTKHKMTIDECQLSPGLFPALKDAVRKNTKPGQYLLTGSVRFTSRKLIRESLTGRILISELLPLTLSEIHETPLINPIKISNYISNSKTLKNLKNIKKLNDIIQYLEFGGLPKITFTRDLKLRNDLRESYLDTILERDLKLIMPTLLSKRVLLNFFKHLSTYQNQTIDISKISKFTAISVPTVKKLLAAFESLYLIRLINSEGYTKKPKLFFEDIGERGYFTKNDINNPNDLIACFYQNIRAYFYYDHHKPFEFFSYVTKGGAHVPLALKTENTYLGFIPNTHGEVTLQMKRSAKSFIDQYGKTAKVFFISLNGSIKTVLPDKMFETPIGLWI